MRSLLPLMLAAAFHLGAHAAPTVVHTEAQLNEALASGKPTPSGAWSSWSASPTPTQNGGVTPAPP